MKNKNNSINYAILLLTATAIFNIYIMDKIEVKQDKIIKILEVKR